MNVLDANIIDSQRSRLRRWRIPVRQIGPDVGHKGIQDHEIIPLLITLRRPTFFTRDAGFYNRRLCHQRYCLVVLAAEPRDVARFVRRVLRHPQFNTEAKRLGCVIRADRSGLTIWRTHAEREARIPWEEAQARR